ncbi:PadR family transcriptional regulator [Haloarcula marina]|uniref:PadR family transcriptional regulator n=1 Tax=Haloarcula marina TaxID=2961574 RepID=UPI0020B6A1F6|nr:helix-turn-helix transcriptional regulator [Halomicroarcula marina]
MSQLVKLEVSGDNPTAHARRILDQYASDETITSVSITINTADSSDQEMKQATTTDYTTDASNEQTREEREAEKEAKREKGNIKTNTSHHRVLGEVAERSNNGSTSVSGKEIKEGVEGVNESSIYPALTQLWERKMLERERVEDVANPYYKYYLTDHGKHTLEDLGKPEPPEDE